MMNDNVLSGCSRACRSPVFLLLCALLLHTFWAHTVRAEEEYGRVASRLVKIVDLDDSGLAIDFPLQIAYDHVYQEVYVLSSESRIVIYDKDYFPQGSIGPGRGVENVSGMAISPEGKLHIARTVYDEVGRGRQSIISIYNTALLVEREIFLRTIPELSHYIVNDLAVSADGEIYLVGYVAGAANPHQGAAVLDGSGNFKRMIAPQGQVLRKRPATFQAPTPVQSEPDSEDPEFVENLPAALKPVKGQDARSEATDEGGHGVIEGAVALESVYIDEVGRLYLLSTEMSEILVYDQKERFLFKFGVKGGAKGKLSTPKALAVDYPRRLIYVVDYMRHTILVYDYDSGKFVYEFGGKGVSPLWYQHPTYLEVDSKGMIIIADMFNHRVQVVDPTTPDRPVLAPILPVAPVVDSLENSTEALPDSSATTPESSVAEESVVPVLPLKIASSTSGLTEATPVLPVKISSVALMSAPTEIPSTEGSTPAGPITENLSEVGALGKNGAPLRQESSVGAKSASIPDDGGELAVPGAVGGMSLATKAGMVVAAPIVAPIALLAAGVSKVIDAVAPGRVASVAPVSAPSVSPVSGAAVPVVPGKVASVAPVSTPRMSLFGVGSTAKGGDSELLTDKRVKADIAMPLPAAGLVAMKPVHKPGQTIAPSGPVAVPAKPMVGKPGPEGAENVIRTVVGVYGPVAVMVGFGAWLLSQRR